MYHYNTGMHTADACRHYRASYFKMYLLARSVIGYIAILAVYTIVYVYSYGTPIRVWDNVMSHTRKGYPICVWANIRILGRTGALYYGLLHEVRLWVATAEIGMDTIMSRYSL